LKPFSSMELTGTPLSRGDAAVPNRSRGIDEQNPIDQPFRPRLQEEGGIQDKYRLAAPSDGPLHLQGYMGMDDLIQLMDRRWIVKGQLSQERAVHSSLGKDLLSPFLDQSAPHRSSIQ
jgi:hypothetical protein